MNRPVLASLARHLVRWYPRQWRQRYAEEFLDVLDQHRISIRTLADLAVNVVAARLDPNHRSRLPERIRTGLKGIGVTASAVVLLLSAHALTFHEETEFGVTGAHDIAFSADGRLVVTSSGASTVRLWDIDKPAHPICLSTVDAGNFVAVSPDGSLIAALGKHVQLWDVGDRSRPTLAARLAEHPADAQDVAFSPDGRLLAMGYHDNVILYDISNPHRPVQRTAFPADPVTVLKQSFMNITFSPDGRTLATSSHSAHLALWTIADPAHPTVVATLPVDILDAEGTTFSPDGNTLVVVRHDGQVQLWNVGDPSRPTISVTLDAATIKGGFTGGVAAGTAVAFSADGHTLVTVIGSEKATAWDISQPGRVVHLKDVIRTGAGPGRFKLSPDGTTVASARHAADTIDVWTLR
jgi:WD40 repeat protein